MPIFFWNSKKQLWKWAVYVPISLCEFWIYILMWNISNFARNKRKSKISHRHHIKLNVQIIVRRVRNYHGIFSISVLQKEFVSRYRVQSHSIISGDFSYWYTTFWKNMQDINRKLLNMLPLNSVIYSLTCDSKHLLSLQVYIFHSLSKHTKHWVKWILCK